MELAVNVLSPESLIETFGLIGILVIVFAETGLLLGFFLPGDSLLFLAGFFASTAASHTLNLPLVPLLIGLPIAAIAGAQVGYYIGKRAGPVLFDRPDSRLFQQEYVDKAEHYFQKFGPARAVVMARFVPIVRTFLNPVAGVLRMDPRQFLIWNVVGGLIWTLGITLAGYGFGKALGSDAQDVNVDRYLLPVIAAVVIISVMPIAFEVLRARREHRRGRDMAEPVDPETGRRPE